MSTTVLVVTDDHDDRDLIVRALNSEPYEVIPIEELDQAEPTSERVDVVIGDLQSTRIDPLELLRRWKARQPETAVLFVTDANDVAAAVEAMKLGAADCVVKPVDAEELRILVAKLLDSKSGNGRVDQGDSSGRQGKRPHITIPPGTSLEDLERAAVEQALTQHHGNRTHAAKTLGISVRTLQRKLKAWGLPLAASAQNSGRKPFMLTPAQSHSSPYRAHAH